MIRHPLDDEFEMPIDENDAVFGFQEVEIPDDPKLATIVQLSMQAYKQQMDDIIHVEPKNRLKFYEVAERYLNQGKDAMYKIEQIKIQREKILKDSRGSTKKPVDGKTVDGKTEGEEEKSSTVVDRKDLQAQVAKMRIVNK